MASTSLSSYKVAGRTAFLICRGDQRASLWGPAFRGVLPSLKECAHILQGESVVTAGVIWNRRRAQAVGGDYGYLQHGPNAGGPFRTERVRIHHEYADRWQAFFAGRWRRVHILVSRTYIVYQGERITIQIDGV